MSFLKCCVGADPRPPPEAIRPVAASNRRNGGNGASDAVGGNKKKMKMPTEVFFDPTKPDGQLSSITDPPNSTREYGDSKKKKEGKEKSGHQQRDQRKANVGEGRADLEAHDNNGLTRGQNFMKVEKWLRQACMHKQINITPGEIANIEDGPSDTPENTADPPSEKDRLPAAMAKQPSLKQPSLEQPSSKQPSSKQPSSSKPR